MLTTMIGYDLSLHETQRLKQEPVPGIDAMPDESNARYFHVIVMGPKDVSAANIGLDGFCICYSSFQFFCLEMNICFAVISSV